MLFNYNNIPENPFDLIPARNGSKDIEKLQNFVDELIQCEGFNVHIVNDLMHRYYSFVEMPLINGAKMPLISDGIILEREREVNKKLLAKLKDFMTYVSTCGHPNHQRIEKAVDSLRMLCSYRKTDPDIWKDLTPLPSKASKIIAYRIYLIIEYIEHYQKEKKTYYDREFSGVKFNRDAVETNKYTKADIFRLISEMFKKICNKQYFSAEDFEPKKIKYLYDNVRTSQKKKLNKYLKKILADPTLCIY